MINQRVEQIDRRRLDAKLGVAGAEALCGIARHRRLVECLITLEADAEGAHGLLQQAAHDANDDCRVETAAEEGAERHVAHQPPLDRGGHQIADVTGGLRAWSRWY